VELALSTPIDLLAAIVAPDNTPEAHHGDRAQNIDCG
jgi:hypothetical protein